MRRALSQQGRSVARSGVHGATADLPRLDFNEEISRSVRPGHRTCFPCGGEKTVMDHFFGESEYQNAPTRLVPLINSVDLEGDAGSARQSGKSSDRRGTKYHAAETVLIGHRQDLRAVESHKADSTGSVVSQEFDALVLGQLDEFAGLGLLLRH